MKRRPAPLVEGGDPSAAAVWRAEESGSAAPLAEVLREAGMPSAAEALLRWRIVTVPFEKPDPDAALVAAVEHFREICPPGHTRRLARRVRRRKRRAWDDRDDAQRLSEFRGEVEAIRARIVEHVADLYGVEAAALAKVLRGRLRSFRERQAAKPRPE